MIDDCNTVLADAEIEDSRTLLKANKKEK